MSVNASAHKMVGFNQWDEEWEVGGISASTGEKTTETGRIRSKNYISVLPSTRYFINASYSSSACYDADKRYISSTPYANGPVAGTYYLDIPSNARYIMFGMPTSYGATYNSDICINLSDPQRNGQYEPYKTHSYPLDSSLTLRGIPKLDANNNLYYDGDIYPPSGEVQRNWAERAFQDGDTSNGTTMITDGTRTVYKLNSSTTETAEPYTALQTIYDGGTEEYVTDSIPVGHNTKYMRDLKKLLEGIPDAPTANGTYVLKATVSSSGVTYAWIAG